MKGESNMAIKKSTKTVDAAPRSYKVYQKRSKWRMPNAAHDRKSMAAELKESAR